MLYEVITEFAKMAEAYKMEVEKVKAYIAAEDLKNDIAVGKAVEFIKEQANIKQFLKPSEAGINTDAMTSFNGGLFMSLVPYVVRITSYNVCYTKLLRDNFV